MLYQGTETIYIVDNVIVDTVQSLIQNCFAPLATPNNKLIIKLIKKSILGSSSRWTKWIPLLI